MNKKEKKPVKKPVKFTWVDTVLLVIIFAYCVVLPFLAGFLTYTYDLVIKMLLFQFFVYGLIWIVAYVNRKGWFYFPLFFVGWFIIMFFHVIGDINQPYGKYSITFGALSFEKRLEKMPMIREKMKKWDTDGNLDAEAKKAEILAMLDKFKKESKVGKDFYYYNKFKKVFDRAYSEGYVNFDYTKKVPSLYKKIEPSSKYYDVATKMMNKIPYYELTYQDRIGYGMAVQFYNAGRYKGSLKFIDELDKRTKYYKKGQKLRKLAERGIRASFFAALEIYLTANEKKTTKDARRAAVLITRVPKGWKAEGYISPDVLREAYRYEIAEYKEKRGKFHVGF